MGEGGALRVVGGQPERLQADDAVAAHLVGGEDIGVVEFADRDLDGRIGRFVRLGEGAGRGGIAHAQIRADVIGDVAGHGVGLRHQTCEDHRQPFLLGIGFQGLPGFEEVFLGEHAPRVLHDRAQLEFDEDGRLGIEGNLDDEVAAAVPRGLRGRGIVAHLGDGEVRIVAHLGEQVPQGRLFAFGAADDAGADDIDDLVLDLDGFVDLVVGIGELAAQLLAGAQSILDPTVDDAHSISGEQCGWSADGLDPVIDRLEGGPPGGLTPVVGFVDQFADSC